MNDDYAALKAYMETFRGDTVEEVAMEEYRGKRYRVTWSGQIYTGGVIKPWHIVTVRRKSEDEGFIVVVAIQDGSYAHVRPEWLVPYLGE